MSEADLALQEFNKICPPHDENNFDREWLEMFGFYWKGWQAKAAQQSEQRTELDACPCGGEHEPKPVCKKCGLHYALSH